MIVLRLIGGGLLIVFGLACVISSAHESIGFTLLGLVLFGVIVEASYRRRGRAP